MSTARIPTKPDALLAIGLKSLWYPICPSHLVAEQPVSMRRLGIKLVLWRNSQAQIQALEDHCPHRGAPLSRGVAMGDRCACPKIWKARPTPTFSAMPSGAVTTAMGWTTWSTRCTAPSCTSKATRWPRGDSTAKFRIRETGDGFVFEKEGQRGVNFDWTEWADTGTHWMRLEIPYPKTGGPSGNFIIIGSDTPITPELSAVFHWRCRKVDGWQRDTWRFFYKSRLEARHWAVLEQDRLMMEDMEPDANQREMLYQHSMGIVRLRRHMRGLATRQIAELTAAPAKA